MKNRTSRLSLTSFFAGILLLGTLQGLRAQPAEPAATKGAIRQEALAGPIELSVTPAEEPRPALRFRLLPISSELNPGNAAPIYLRLQNDLPEGSWKQISEKHDEWGEVPLEKLPVSEARKFVDQWTGSTSLLKIGTRRQFCDWSYPLAEQRQEMIEILLPDCQAMRQWARLLQIKARVETVEQNYGQAIDTIQTGMAFGRHVGQGPFLINNLVGISICSVMLDRAQEVISQPGAPNLYWALSTLPRPLVSLRDALETEQRMGENMIPELAITDGSHSRAQWGVLVENLYDRLRRLAEKITSDPKVNAKLRSQLDLDVASFKKEHLAPSQDYLKKTRRMDSLRVKVMSDDEVIARALVGQYQDMRDDYYKITYLPWRDARTQSDAAEARLRLLKSGPLVVLAELQSSVMNCLRSQMYLDRRVAGLRAVEALRLHAASHDSKLPGELKEVAEVPVPEDPATGRPFEYHRDGDAAVLVLPDAGVRGRPITSYRISIRKPSSEKKP
jgi:hypothetical protein